MVEVIAALQTIVKDVLIVVNFLRCDCARPMVSRELPKNLPDFKHQSSVILRLKMEMHSSVSCAELMDAIN